MSAPVGTVHYASFSNTAVLRSGVVLYDTGRSGMLDLVCQAYPMFQEMIIFPINKNKPEVNTLKNANNGGQRSLAEYASSAWGKLLAWSRLYQPMGSAETGGSHLAGGKKPRVKCFFLERSAFADLPSDFNLPNGFSSSSTLCTMRQAISDVAVLSSTLGIPLKLRCPSSGTWFFLTL